MREEMDGKVVYFPPESALLPLMLCFLTVLFPICTLTWRANNYVSRQEKVKIRETKVQRQKNFCEFDRTLQNFESHSSEPLLIFQELFRTFSETLSICIKPSSERVYSNL